MNAQPTTSNDAAACLKRGMSLRQQGQFESAEQELRQAITLQPNCARAHDELGCLLRLRDATLQAEMHHRIAIRLDPGMADAWCNLSAALAAGHRLGEAEAAARTALALGPDCPSTLNNIATLLSFRERWAEAEGFYRRAIALAPNFSEAHFNFSLHLLKQGRLAEGWPLHEWRWMTRHQRATYRTFEQPVWRGEPLAGRTILLHAEQGFGDTLQFCRYAPLVARAGRVILEVQPSLVSLLKSLHWGHGLQVMARGDAVPDFDLHCPLASLPLAFRTTLETIPAPARYLTADPARVAQWRTRLEALPGAGRRLRVGLVWSGDPRLAADRRRSMPRQALAPLAALSDRVEFFSVQKAMPGLKPSRLPLDSMQDFSADFIDFGDTAAVLDCLNLVICVDTSVVHLSAALGRPTWLLNRADTCWRWLLERDDSPWYPSMHIFRQRESGKWDDVVARVITALGALAAQHDVAHHRAA